MEYDSTLEFYNEHAPNLVKTYAGAGPTYLAHLKTLLRRESSTVLDIGCGTGRDVAALRADGFDAIGVDASPTMIAAGVDHYGLETRRLRADTLPELRSISERYDAVLCAAVLQHIPDSQLLDSLYRIRSLVAPDGFLMLSVPIAYPADDESRDRHGRLVRVRPAEQYRFFLERLGLREVVEYEEADSLNRDGIRWQVLLFGSTGSEELRPIEIVESVLWDDRKVNTYKFALIRAIAHLATHRPNIARWEAEAQVSIPIDAIADKWIGYYWPLMESSTESAVVSGSAWREGRYGVPSPTYRSCRLLGSTRRVPSFLLSPRRWTHAARVRTTASSHSREGQNGDPATGSLRRQRPYRQEDVFL